LNDRVQKLRRVDCPNIDQEVHLKRLLFGVVAAALAAGPLMAQGKVNPTDPQPTCNMCPGTYVQLSEFEAYTKKAIAENLIDQQVRDIDIGKAHIGIGIVYRGKLDKPAPNSVAEHDQVSEVYHVISGSATLVVGPDITDRQRRPATERTVVQFNGPGNNGAEIRNGKTYQLKPGDVVVIPAGTGHWFTKIDDHINYLMVRLDPDKVTPVRGETESKEYLSKPAPPR
jgi:mannose-6-phosphate isomerase-like protein (cupin superfamily)